MLGMNADLDVFKPLVLNNEADYPYRFSLDAGETGF